MDFTYRKLEELLDCLLDKGYSFQTLEDFINNPSEKSVILRHDVDKAPFHSSRTAKLENNKGIRGTYYFRIIKQSNDPQVIKEIAGLGHEIGYHYEDLAMAHGDPEAAIISFRQNLEYFRTFYPVKTICMHGSPVSKWDNRDLWKKFSYRDFGIIAEPYYNLDYHKILYLTDTGRKWNGVNSSVRDKVSQENFMGLKEKLKTSNDILSAVSADELPQQMIITMHPQRWTDNLLYWISEYSKQAIKNRVKQLFFVK